MFSGSRRQPTDSELKSTVSETVGDIKTNTQATAQNIEQSTQTFNTKKRGSFSERFNQSSYNTARRDMANIRASAADAFESLAARNDDTFAQNALSDRYL